VCILQSQNNLLEKTTLSKVFISSNVSNVFLSECLLFVYRNSDDCQQDGWRKLYSGQGTKVCICNGL